MYNNQPEIGDFNPQFIRALATRYGELFEIYTDGREGNDCIDDGFIHLNRDGFRFTIDCGEQYSDELLNSELDRLQERTREFELILNQ